LMLKESRGAGTRDCFGKRGPLVLMRREAILRAPLRVVLSVAIFIFG
jgi:hypothetical protein